MSFFSRSSAKSSYKCDGATTASMRVGFWRVSVRKRSRLAPIAQKGTGNWVSHCVSEVFICKGEGIALQVLRFRRAQYKL